MSYTSMDKGIPGFWMNFEEAAAQAVEGSDGVVAVIKKNYNVTATAGTVYEFSSESQAKEIIGTTKMDDIRRIFKGGANKVIVYTQPAAATDYTGAQAALELEFFEALTFDHVLPTADIPSWKDWLTAQQEDEKYIPTFFGGTSADDQDLSVGNARSTTANHELLFNVINGVKLDETTELASYEAAQWVAGQYAATPLTQSLTYKVYEDAVDVNRRVTDTEIKTALNAGSLVFKYDGRRVRLVQGVSTAKKSAQQLALKQVMARDWKFLVEENYIGKVQNGPNERLYLQGELKNYMGVFEGRSIVEPGTWWVKVTQGDTKKKVVIEGFAVNLETMEEVYAKVTLG